MRADLHTMEQIDLYLQGKLTGSQLREFENLMASDPALKSMVSDQQLLIQTVNRKALLAEIHAVAGIGGTPWYANPAVAVTGAALVVGGISATIYFMNSETAEPTNDLATNEQIIQPESPQTTEETYLVDESDYADTLTQTESDGEQLSHTTHQHHTTDSYEEPLLTEHPDINNQADHLSQQADDHIEEVVERDHVSPNTESFTSKNRAATYPKGELALKEFIQENMRFPGTAKEKKISGNVKVKFLVTPEGTRTNIEASCFNLRDENDKPLTSTQVMLNQKIANLFEREAERVVRIMPVWIPATDSQGNGVLSPVELYFNFSLKEGNSVYRID